MKGLQEREKKLLVFLALFLIVALSVWLIILPAVQDRQDLEDAIVTAQARTDELTAKLAQYQIDLVDYDALSSEHAAAVDSFYDPMENQEIDRLITGIVLKRGLIARDLVISGGEVPEAVEPFYASGLTASAYAGVYISNVSLRAEGTRTALLGLVDMFTNDLPAIRVTEYQLAEGKAAEKPLTAAETAEIQTTPGEKPYELTLTVAIYMCNKVTDAAN